MFAVIGIVIGSDLPDIDAKRAPISKMFQIFVPGTLVLVSLGWVGLWPPLGFALGALALWLYPKQMPRHRGSVHTIRAGLLPVEWVVPSPWPLCASVEGPVD